MLTKEQIAHFETFGFLAMRQLFSSEEMATISTEFEEILNEDRQGRPFAGENRQEGSVCLRREGPDRRRARR